MKLYNKEYAVCDMVGVHRVLDRVMSKKLVVGFGVFKRVGVYSIVVTYADRHNAMEAARVLKRERAKMMN